MNAVLAGLFLVPTACGQPHHRLEAPVHVTFDLHHNRVYVPVSIGNAGPFGFVLDTGASLSGLDDGRARELHLPSKGRNPLVANGEAAMTVGLAQNVTLTVGNLALPQSRLAVLPFAQLDSFEGRKIDGVLGVDLLRNYVVEIDYGSKTMVVHDPTTFHYTGTGEIVPLQFRGNAALFWARLEVAGTIYDAALAIDLGTYGALRLYKHFVDAHHLLALAHPVPGFGFGLGGEFPEAQGRVQALHIGNTTIPAPTTGFSQTTVGATASAYYDGTIGGEIFRRFRVILDYPHSRAIFEPNSTFQEPFVSDTSGLVLTATGDDLNVISVHRVLPNTPAAEDGIEPGDTVESIDGISAARLGLEVVRRLFQRVGVYDVTTIRRRTEVIRLTLRTRPLS